MTDTRQDLRGPMESDEIADGAVTTVKIPDGAITQDKSPFAVDGFQDNQYLKEGVASGLATDVTGTQTLTESLDSSYGSSLDGVLIIGEDFSDTDAEVDNLRVREETISASEFDIEAEIKASGVSGKYSSVPLRYLGKRLT